jgi:hypothetical protein
LVRPLCKIIDLAKPKIVRPQYEAGATYEDFVFFFGAFFFLLAMVLFLAVGVINLRQVGAVRLNLISVLNPGPSTSVPGLQPPYQNQECHSGPSRAIEKSQKAFIFP